MCLVLKSYQISRRAKLLSPNSKNPQFLTKSMAWPFCRTAVHMFFTKLFHSYHFRNTLVSIFCINLLSIAYNGVKGVNVQFS